MGYWECCCDEDCCFDFVQTPHPAFATVTISGATAFPFTTFNGIHICTYVGTFGGVHQFGKTFATVPSRFIIINATCHPVTNPTADGYWVICREATPPLFPYVAFSAGDNPPFATFTPSVPRCTFQNADAVVWNHAMAGLHVDNLVFA